MRSAITGENVPCRPYAGREEREAREVVDEEEDGKEVNCGVSDNAEE
jgi:hypothetical protein